MEFQLASLWEALTDAGPDHTCLVVGDDRHTRRSLDDKANQVAHHLLSIGVGPGDRVGLLTYNRVEHVEGRQPSVLPKLLDLGFREGHDVSGLVRRSLIMSCCPGSTGSGWVLAVPG
jgi:hypothetical protein